MIGLTLLMALAQDMADLPGRWYPTAYRSLADSALNPAERAQIQQLEALGYLGGTVPDDPLSGVVRHHRDEAWQGVNLYSSGHRPEALLMDMDGRVLHRWHCTFLDAFPGGEALLKHHSSAHTWRRVALLADGSLLVIFEGIGLVKLGPDSRVIWASRNRAHHDLEPLANGHVLVLTRIARPQPLGMPILEDFVAELDADGRELRRVSVLKALQQSGFADLVQADQNLDSGDILHTNALHLLDGRAARANPAFTAGRVLLSSRTQGFLAVLDLDSERVIWAARGSWAKQHDAEITPSGRLLLFDNQGPTSGNSRVLALDPADPARTLWSWSGTPGAPLHSEVLGAAQELPNGNILITESTRGRALEIGLDGTLVWEYHNPETAQGRFVAAIYEMLRLPASAADFLSAKSPGKR